MDHLAVSFGLSSEINMLMWVLETSINSAIFMRY